MRVLVLVIYSENNPLYKEHLDGWRLYSKKNSDVDVFFMVLQSDITEKKLDDDILYIPGEESYQNLPYKFISALEYFDYKTYDYILRTNISSFWVFPNLIKVLETMPRKNLFAGKTDGSFVSGAGMLFTPDVCNILVKYKKRLFAFRPLSELDDIRISYYLNLHHEIECTPLYPTMYHLWYPNTGFEENIPTTIFHFRLKQNDEHRDKESQLMRNLVQRFYENL
jgi:hypothetical protein